MNIILIVIFEMMTMSFCVTVYTLRVFSLFMFILHHKPTVTLNSILFYGDLLRRQHNIQGLYYNINILNINNYLWFSSIVKWYCSFIFYNRAAQEDQIRSKERYLLPRILYRKHAFFWITLVLNHVKKFNMQRHYTVNNAPWFRD